MIVKEGAEVILIFQEQNPLAWPEQMIPRNLGDRHCRRFIRVKIEGNSLLQGTVAEVRRWQSRRHNPKRTSKTGAVGRKPERRLSILISDEFGCRVLKRSHWLTQCFGQNI